MISLQSYFKVSELNANDMVFGKINVSDGTSFLEKDEDDEYLHLCVECSSTDLFLYWFVMATNYFVIKELIVPINAISCTMTVSITKIQINDQNCKV